MPEEKGKWRASILLPQLSILSTVIAAMHLPANFSAGEAHRVHVRIGGTGAKRAEEAREVMLREGLIVGGRIQPNDVVCSR